MSKMVELDDIKLNEIMGYLRKNYSDKCKGGGFVYDNDNDFNEVEKGLARSLVLYMAESNLDPSITQEYQNKSPIDYLKERHPDMLDKDGKIFLDDKILDKKIENITHKNMKTEYDYIIKNDYQNNSTNTVGKIIVNNREVTDPKEKKKILEEISKELSEELGDLL